MSATIKSAWYGWCGNCAEGSDVGLTHAEARAWTEQHNKDNHGDVTSEDTPLATGFPPRSKNRRYFA